MSDLKEFSPQSKQEWISKVEKELKRFLNDFEKRFSYAHSEDLENIPSPLLVHGKDQSWLIRERFIFENTELTNKQLLKSLNSGVQELYIETKIRLNSSQLDTLFEGIYLNMLHIHWNGPFNQDTYDFLKNKQPESLIFEWPDLERQVPKNSEVEDGILSSFVLREQIEENRMDGIISLLKRAVNKLDKISNFSNEDELTKGFVFVINSTTDFIPEIALLRSFRLVWANILAAYGKNPLAYPAKIIYNIGDQADPQDPNTNLIRFTIQAVSGILGGAQSIEIAPANGNYHDEFRRRNSRNIHHLLKAESFLDKVTDPGAGSYAIQLLTADYCKKVWEAIK